MTTSAADWRARKRVVDVDGVAMAVVERGEPGGRDLVLLHGNPTSSFLWRDVVPHLEGLGRVLVPDLVGMGDSGPAPDGRYRFVDHRRYLDGLLEALGVGDDVVLVVHDWGSALGFDWANRQRERVAGIAYTEAIVRPLAWDEWPAAARRIFGALRSEAGEELVLEQNAFVERILPASVLDPLSEDVLAEYRRPFAQAGEARRPTLTWPREIPLDGEPADVTAIVQAYADWLVSADVPTLFLDADPGSILVGPQRDFCLGWPSQTHVRVRGSHFVPEDAGPEIGQAVATMVRGLA